MKKSILIIALLAFTFVSFAQTKKDSLKQSTAATVKKDTAKAKPYAPDPKTVYLIGLTYDQIASVLITSKAGLLPYLKTTQMPFNKLDEVEKSFAAIHSLIEQQVNRQLLNDREKFVADSLKVIKRKK
jgi:hypothetical protein